MAVDVTAAPAGARTGAQFLDGLRDDGREVWMGGEKVERHRRAPAARAARHAAWPGGSTGATSTPETCLYPSPTTGQPVNVSFLQPRSREDLDPPPRGHAPDGGVPRRRDGPRARLPQRDVRAVRGARRRLGAARQRAGRRESRSLLRADARARPLDDARDHEPAGRPLAPRRRGRRRRDRPPQGRRDVRGHRRARRAHARDARALRRRDLDLPGQPAAAQRTPRTRSASRSR